MNNIVKKLDINCTNIDKNDTIFVTMVIAEKAMPKQGIPIIFKE